MSSSSSSSKSNDSDSSWSGSDENLLEKNDKPINLRKPDEKQPPKRFIDENNVHPPKKQKNIPVSDNNNEQLDIPSLLMLYLLTKKTLDAEPGPDGNAAEQGPTFGNAAELGPIIEPVADEEDDSETRETKYWSTVTSEMTMELVDLMYNVKGLDDLIKLGESYHFEPGKKYAIDMRKCKKLVAPLKKLNALIGMNSLKQSLTNQIMYFLAGLNNGTDLMHTIIEGDPGCGKTTVALILAEIYQCLGFTENTKFKIMKRADLVAGYLGQTAMKTQKVIDEAMGGILFIDEAYSLGNKEKEDSFAKEALDTLNQNLSERAGKFICIIAGYANELDLCFFRANPGLRSRFPFCYTIDEYSSTDLKDIFIKKVNDDGWTIEQGNQYGNTLIQHKIFHNNNNTFPNSGRDITTLLQLAKVEHSKRIFGRHNIQKKVLSQSDIEKGYQQYLKLSSRNNNNNTISNDIITTMYM